ncbi:hypothetical protein A3D00_03155 [Candidatus Woesebacteria bacterium RIFCSPHIGHO2_02_FULL_38_9]|uniref:DUF6884 domain-containing protein n=1 Tax=Candidatus Woesebacteria bacterium RIFCSPHIGHO2_01_FULL_39_28 TaxID=1802496 RepID=A0A1F7YI46_9BACT|nr:MAG: hypothetical protein A2627_05600 [Candidatus Woesebacteria bacterium RIFCSPHIGHO2_01_FULL_39_28]OGM31469.1 MAG: hypothetical protein A3D00_03155 [Candidatus Woesebacteria bacterium RIFCSPHIGHO2_02_FULL_38_9]OGM56653.1 MAG: hypothetical protein A3A50_04795 [Candidatus Woesebacteria bacterium RIFCSPLOWO2_01_FULL_38_20]
MQNINKPLRIGLIAGARRVNSSATTVREYYNPSPLFRYRLKYCEKNCDQVVTISPAKFLARLNDLPSYENQGLENITRKEFKEWKSQMVKAIEETIPTGSTLVFLAGNRFRQLIPLLSERYICEEPTRGMDIGKQLKFFVKLLGKEAL